MSSPRIEFTQYISPDGTTYRFDNNRDRFVLGGVSGLGLPPIEYQTQRGPFQDGETVLGFSFEPRVIQLLHRRKGGCREDYWTNRSDIINILRPNRQSAGSFQPGVLRKILPDLSKRDLDVFIQRSLSFDGTRQGEWDEFSFTEAIQFVAHNPIIYNPVQQIQDLTLPSYGDQLAFAATFPISFSSNANVPLDSITYVGTYKAYPKIKIRGPFNAPAIRNITTGAFIQLETNIAANRLVTIDLAVGAKTVTDDLGANLIGTMTTESDLTSFYLAPDPEAVGGVNEFGINGGGITADSKITIEWFDRYIGI